MVVWMLKGQERGSGMIYPVPQMWSHRREPLTQSTPGYFNLVPGPLPVPHQPEEGELGMVVVHKTSLGYIMSYRLYKTLSEGRKETKK